jgi:hypothetical protein
MNTTRTPMQIIEGVVNNGAYISFGDRFPSVIKDESALESVAGICGFIVGLSMNDRSRAELMAEDFINTIDYLSRSHERIPQYPHIEGSYQKVMSSVMCLGRDGFMSLGFTIWSFVPNKSIADLRESDPEKLERVRLIDDRGERCNAKDALSYKTYYEYCFNGGIIFRGGEYKDGKWTIKPHGGRNNRDWSTHT